MDLLQASGTMRRAEGVGGAQKIYEVAPAGFLEQHNRVAIFNGGVGVPVTSTGVVKNLPVGVYRLRCLTAGTVKLWDNASAASGTVIVDTVAMSAGQVVEVGEIVANGVFATVTSGTYSLVCTA